MRSPALSHLAQAVRLDLGAALQALELELLLGPGGEAHLGPVQHAQHAGPRETRTGAGALFLFTPPRRQGEWITRWVDAW